MLAAYLYSPVSILFGEIRFTLQDSRQAAAKANSTSPAPAMATNPVGTEKVHFTIPIPRKNREINGLINKQLTISPSTVAPTIAGRKESAVCSINCPLVKPSAFRIPYSCFFLPSSNRTSR